jgi:hypothetical protein
MNNDLCVCRIRHADREAGSTQRNENAFFQFHSRSGDLLLFFEIESSERLQFGLQSCPVILNPATLRELLERAPAARKRYSLGLEL